MKLLPLQGREKIRIACQPDELDRALEIIQLIFAKRCRVVIHQGIATVTIKN